MSRKPGFFHDEIRNGFYIPTAIKQSWASQLDVLDEIDRICEKHGITYFADWGSFLGAVRHAGFVPWDDDIDICMKRDDYIKFREVADNELPADYVIHDYERQPDHWLFLSRVVNSPRIRFDVEYLNTHYNFHWLSGVDIFVKDYLYRDPAMEKKRCDEIMFILAVAEGVINGSYNMASLRKHLNDLSRRYSYTFPDGKPGRNLAVSLYRLAELQMARVPESESDRVCQIFPWGLKGNPGEPKELYEKTTRLAFEDTTIPVPAMYNQTLKNHYGNYLEIRKGAAAHDYPSFEAQRRLFEEGSGVTLPRFTFDESMLHRTAPDKSGSIKTLAKECLEGLLSLFESTRAAYLSADTDTLQQAIADTQQLAVNLGTTIEYVRGEQEPHARAIVTVLENLCENLYALYQNISSCENDNDASQLLSPIEKSLSELTVALDVHLLSRREVLFLPVGVREWKTMRPLHDEYARDPGTDISVVHLPLLFKDYFGNITMTEDEILADEKSQQYPEDLITSRFTEYDLALHCPDTVVIQNPYDETNPCLTVPVAFYAKELLKSTDELIYIPIGATSEFTESDTTDQTNLRFYVTAPGVILSDRVYVQSRNIREQYISALSSFAGNNTRDFWAKKIAPKPELFDITPKHPSSPKKELLFCIGSYEQPEHREIYASALTGRIDILLENSESIHVTICAHPGAGLDPFTEAIVNEKGIDIVRCDLDSLDTFASQFDAYYGSASPIVPYFAALRKPVMIADYGV